MPTAASAGTRRAPCSLGSSASTSTWKGSASPATIRSTGSAARAGRSEGGFVTVIPYETPEPPPPDFPDRRASLTAAGTVSVILGMISGALTLLMLAGVLLSRRPAPAASRVGDVVERITLFAAASAFLIWTGVGAIRLRRWARPVMLAAGWTWLAMGSLFLIFYVLSLARMLEA